MALGDLIALDPRYPPAAREQLGVEEVLEEPSSHWETHPITMCQPDAAGDQASLEPHHVPIHPMASPSSSPPATCAHTGARSIG